MDEPQWLQNCIGLLCDSLVLLAAAAAATDKLIDE